MRGWVPRRCGAIFRIGCKRIIWASILGMAPFTLLLPYANLAGAAVLTVLIGLFLRRRRRAGRHP